MRKIFVLDTNVLLHDASSIERFADNVVVLPMAVIEELDRFKKGNDELGRNARAVIRRLDALRAKGHLGEGVPMANGGLLRIVNSDVGGDDGLDSRVADNRIVRVAWQHHRGGERVIFVSKDINARIKADALGIEAQDFEKQKVNFDELCRASARSRSPAISSTRSTPSPSSRPPDAGLFPNEFILLRDETNEKHTALARGARPRHAGAPSPQYERAWDIKPRNMEQRMALELLLDPTVQLVTLVGQAGTGKTLLALAGGLQSVVQDQQLREDPGLAPDHAARARHRLPAGLQGREARSHWMQPIFDNLTYLLRERNGGEESVYPTGSDKVE